MQSVQTQTSPPSLDIKSGKASFGIVDIYRYPDKKDTLIPNKTIRLSLGDLHSNAIKLLHFLIKQNVLDIDPADYDKLVVIYNKETKDLTAEDIALYDSIIDNAKILNNAHPLIMGDDFADRGSNDIFVEKIYEKLGIEKTPFNVLISNHTYEFIIDFEKNFENFTTFRDRQQFGSYDNMGRLFKKGILSIDRLASLKEMIKKYYVPRLQLVSYVREPRKITLFTHAPNDMTIIKRLIDAINASGLDYPGKQPLTYSDRSTLALARSIDKLNEEFTKIAVAGKISALFRLDTWTKNNPFYDLLWQRWSQVLHMTRRKNGYDVAHVNGHDLNMPAHFAAFVTSLDNSLGRREIDHDKKIINQNIDEYSIHVAQEPPPLTIDELLIELAQRRFKVSQAFTTLPISEKQSHKEMERELDDIEKKIALLKDSPSEQFTSAHNIVLDLLCAFDDKWDEPLRTTQEKVYRIEDLLSHAKKTFTNSIDRFEMDALNKLLASLQQATSIGEAIVQLEVEFNRVTPNNTRYMVFQRKITHDAFFEKLNMADFSFHYPRLIGLTLEYAYRCNQQNSDFQNNIRLPNNDMYKAFMVYFTEKKQERASLEAFCKTLTTTYAEPTTKITAYNLFS